MTTAKHLRRYGSIREPALVSGSNGSGWGGEIMNIEKQQSKVVLLSQIGKEELAEVLVELIKNNREVQRAILNLAFFCPNIVTQMWHNTISFWRYWVYQETHHKNDT